MALSLGLKVDAEALPADLVAPIKAGKVNIDDPASTVALLKVNAVVGVTGFLNADGSARSVGIQCAICHSTVDDSFAPGIGKRLDGWGNRDLNVGAIVATAPNLKPFSDLLGVDVATVKTVLNSWGPGRYDAELNMDGKAKRPNGKSAATMMPSAFGLAGVNQHTWTGGWGTVTYWNAYVANTQMYGQGTFFDSRLNNAKQYPVAAKAGWGHKRDAKDLITAKLPALHFYQLAMPVPKAPAGSYDESAAKRGEAVFNSTAKCSTCHVPPIFTEPGHNLHKGREIGIDSFQADRGPERIVCHDATASVVRHRKDSQRRLLPRRPFRISFRGGRSLRSRPEAATVTRAEEGPGRILEVDIEARGDGDYQISQAADRYAVVGLSPSSNSIRYSPSPGPTSVTMPLRPL